MGAFLSIISWLCTCGRRPRASAANQEVITSEKWDDITSREAAVPVLILGRFESPRDKFVDTACSRASMEIKPEPNLKSSDVSIRHTVVEGHPVKLVTAPGFDNPHKSNLAGLMDFAQYLQSGELKSGVKGIVYVHHAGDNLHSRSLSENLNVLFGVILGQSVLRLLTILVVLPGSEDAGYSTSLLAKMQASDSAFSAAHEAGARIITSALGEADVFDVLKECATNSFALLQIQRDRPPNLQQAIEQALGYSDTNSVEAALARREDSTTKKYLPKLEAAQAGLAATQKELEQTRQALAGSQQKAARYSALHQQLETQLVAEQKRIQDLSHKLQETQSEYSSLRSQLQIQENTEQSDIVLGLKDLNRAIEEIGRAFSTHFADHYAGPIFDKDVLEITTLDARDLTTLQVTFDHVEGSASFVKSSSGAGMPVEDFFDYGIRHLLCSFLWQRIFNAFHPGVDESFDQMLGGIYQSIQLREPQTVAAKWRVNSFMSIESSEKSDEVRKAIITNHANEFCEGIKATARAFFGQDKDIQLEATHANQVEKLVKMAWEWNTKLKGEVIVLGDFTQTCFHPRNTFDPNAMDEFEPRKGSKAERILGTLGLGLVSRQAVGGGQPPEATLVCKAMVATESLYD